MISLFLYVLSFNSWILQQTDVSDVEVTDVFVHYETFCCLIYPAAIRTNINTFIVNNGSQLAKMKKYFPYMHL